MKKNDKIYYNIKIINMTAEYISIVLYLTWDEPNSYFCIFRTCNKYDLKYKKNFNKLAKSSVKSDTWFRCTIYQKIKIQAKEFESILTTKLNDFHLTDNVYHINTDQFIRIWGNTTKEHIKFVKNNLHFAQTNQLPDTEFLYFN